jgi:uncharacterized phage protein (TIGR01671 family)
MKLEQRPIEFRAWDKRNKVMEYSNILKQITCFFPYQDINERISYAQLETNDYVLMQFTGLFDKNNKKIFEGDIVKDCLDNIGIVKYLCWKAFCGFTVDTINSVDWCRNNGVFDCEVIGNIFEDSKLIEENK